MSSRKNYFRIRSLLLATLISTSQFFLKSCDSVKFSMANNMNQSDSEIKFLSDEELNGMFPNLPPDPGEAGKITLEGITSGDDGIRDDVKRLIYKLFPHDELKRKAFFQLAKARLESFLATENRELSILRDRDHLRASECVEFVFEGTPSFFKVKDEYEVTKSLLLSRKYADIVEAQISNTQLRIQAALQTSFNFSGQIYELTKSGEEDKTCDFNVDEILHKLKSPQK